MDMMVVYTGSSPCKHFVVAKGFVSDMGHNLIVDRMSTSKAVRYSHKAVAVALEYTVLAALAS